MKKENRLSENLRAYRKVRGRTQAELSKEPGVPVSTLQTVLRGGNTTLDPLIRLSHAMDASLDEPVFSEHGTEGDALLRKLMTDFGYYANMTEEQRAMAWYHMRELGRLMKQEGE